MQIVHGAFALSAGAPVPLSVLARRHKSVECVLNRVRGAYARRGI